MPDPEYMDYLPGVTWSSLLGYSAHEGVSFPTIFPLVFSPVFTFERVGFFLFLSYLRVRIFEGELVLQWPAGDR